MKSILDTIPVKDELGVSNQSSLILDDSESVFCVKAGTVYLFAVEKLEDGRTGSRYHVATFQEGEVFFPLPAFGENSFIAVGTLNTSVDEYDSGVFFGAFSGKGDLAQLEKYASSWIHKITGNLRRRYEGEKAVSSPLVASGEYPANVFLYSQTLAWVRPDDGIQAFNGISLRDWTGSEWFPVTLRQTIRLAEAKSVAIRDFAEGMRGDDFRRLFGTYNAKVSELLCAEKREHLEAEDARIYEKFRRADRDFSATLERVRGILDSGQGDVQIDDSGYENQFLFLAARLAAAAQHIELNAIPGKEYTVELNGIDELAKDNNIRIRQVLLRDNWWIEDNGPLLGFIMNKTDGDETANFLQTMRSGSPVALLPEDGKSYYAVDPQTGTRLFLDQETAQAVSPVAYMFYRPFPNKKIGLADIFRFTSEGLMIDAGRFAVLGLLGTIIGLLIPEITRVFMDTIIPEAAKNQMFQLTMLIVLSTVTAGLFDLIKGFSMTRLETKSDSVLQAAVMDRVMKMPVPFFRDYTAGDLSERTLAISQIRRILSGTVLSSLMSFVFSLVYLFQLFRYSPDMAKWGLLFCLVPIVVTAFISVLQYRCDKQVADLQGSITGTLLQFIMGVGKLNITASEKRAFGVWAKKFIEKKRLAFRSGFFNNIHSTFTSFFPVIVTTLFYVLFMSGMKEGLESGKEPLSTGSFLAFMASFTAFQAALVGMTTALMKTINVVPLYKRAKPILDGMPEIQVSKPSVLGLRGNIEVSHINFRYGKEAPLVLKDVSIKVEPGEFVALVGGSGSGKSTLLRLLLGFEKAESGSIYFDNKDLDSLDISSVRRQMGVVLQNGSIMQGSIYKNIVGSSILTIDDAWDAANMVGLDEDIRAMPMGMHTELPPGGGTLSGGQRQRLIIARAIIRKPKILFFDEATSALDNRTQAIVSESLESLKVTRIVIAHRLSTVMKADRIYVLQNGVIEECGNYAELMEKKGFFYELAKRQQI